MSEFPIRVSFDYKAICELFNIPPEHVRNLTVTSVSDNMPASYAYLTVELKMPISHEQFDRIASLG